MGKKTDRGSVDTELDLIRSERTSLTDLPLHGPMNVGRGENKKSGCKDKRCRREKYQHRRKDVQTEKIIKVRIIFVIFNWGTESPKCFCRNNDMDCDSLSFSAFLQTEVIDCDSNSTKLKSQLYIQSISDEMLFLKPAIPSCLPFAPDFDNE